MNDILFGVAGPVFMKAARYKWEHVSGPHALEVCLDKMSNTVIDKTIENDVRIDFSLLVRLLFDQVKYPDLKEGEYFVISGLLLEDNFGSVTIVGNVVKLLEEGFYVNKTDD